MKQRSICGACCLAALLAFALAVRSQGPRPQPSITIDPDGTVVIKNASLPLPALLSEGGRKVLMRTKPTEGPGAPVPVPTGISDMAEVRRVYNENLMPYVDHMRAIFPVDIEETTIDGVSAAIGTPQGGGARTQPESSHAQRPRRGGFRTGVRGNGLLISIPVAATLGVKVVTITYRQGPEHRFPAASEDFLKVWRNMLKSYKPQNIGMVGCSAGAALISQTTAILIRDGLPTPGVLGVYCGGLGPSPAGDSQFLGALSVTNAPEGRTQRTGGPMSGPTYYTGVDMNQFVVSPTLDEKLLAKFPPTIFFTATRDFAMSGAAYSYHKLLKVGVESQLLVYDGLYHGFMTNPDFPESQEAYKLTATFFDKHLGR